MSTCEEGDPVAKSSNLASKATSAITSKGSKDGVRRELPHSKILFTRFD
jgi:hypothetical protein